MIVQSNVYTTLGSFGKAAYQSTMRSGNTPIPNVFLSDNLEDRTSFHGTKNSGLMELQQATLRVSLADMDTADSTYIKTGAKLIINVPRDWTNVSIDSATGFDGDTNPDPLVDSRVTPLGDGSTQIIGITNVNIGGPLVTDKDALTIQFKATPPENEICGQNRPYIMYVLADGQTDTNFPIGPLNEIALVVAFDPAIVC